MFVCMEQIIADYELKNEQVCQLIKNQQRAGKWKKVNGQQRETKKFKWHTNCDNLMYIFSLPEMRGRLRIKMNEAA